MKKKLNLYCIMFILSIVLGSCVNFAVYFKDIKSMCSAAITEVDKIGYEDYNPVAISVLPKSLFNDAPQDSIYNEITKEKEAVDFDRIEVRVPKEKSVSSLSNNALSTVGSILAMVGFLGFWVVFFKVIRSVKRGDVFISSVASYMKKAAIFLIVAYIGELMDAMAHYIYVTEVIELADYNIIPELHFNDSKLYVAFGLMLLSQIIMHGKELKDEQDLTI